MLSPTHRRKPMSFLAWPFVLTAALAATADAQQPAAPNPAPTATYWVYAGAESADLIHRIRFGPDGATVEKTIPAGMYPTEMEGPHGLAIGPDGKYLHMTTGHGLPDGMYWKIELGPDTVVGAPIPLGKFPATLDVTPDGLYAFIVNFNLHGEHVPSDISVVFTADLVEVARIETCTMPHGSRLNPAGTMQYSACMMDDQLVELDTRTFEVARRFGVAKGKEGPIAVVADADASAMDHSAHGMAHEPSCSPTWAQPSATGDRIFVACTKSDEILEIDATDWKLLRRFPTGRGIYNLAVSPDGRLLVGTLKQGNAIEVFDIAAGTSNGRIDTSIKLAHGIVISPDSRYAFVTVEGIGAEPGKVDIFDLAAMKRVASVDVGQQASGIAFWKMENQ
jgi:DNA-binding beta-propeller fold protein YncE